MSRGEFLDQLPHTGFRRIDFAEVSNLTVTPRLCNRNSIAQLCNIDSDKNLCIFSYGSSSLHEALLAHRATLARIDGRAAEAGQVGHTVLRMTPGMVPQERKGSPLTPEADRPARLPRDRPG